MKLQVGDMIMYEAEMMKVIDIGHKKKKITLEWLDDSMESHHFGPFTREEYKEWPVL